MADSKTEGFAEDLGKLLGTAQSKAEGWLGQRKQIAKTLEDIRDTASKLLADLGHEVQRIRSGRPAGSKNAKPAGRKRRKMSAKARAAISAAQKKRWAKKKAGERK
ncbi:MAG: hypothetical protein A3F69_03805 [Acidobacteria bacterium RIFCSPLOWO2_12_FULL_66_10]|nr:MAG: hypothetical protein A3F69_03805 [Acidobacteria bacterium RIFCSPLOWO2_12_FULL_66_10]